MNQEEQWLLEEKYNVQKSAPAFNESPDEIKNKYPWGEAFHSDLVLLKNGTPLAYLIGSIPFLDCKIHLDSHPLIPRTETEFWTEKAIGFIQVSRTPDIRVLDLCSGSGAIGVAVACSMTNAHVTFGEIDKKHLSTIVKNLERNTIAVNRYSVVQSDLFENISGTFDFILTNPPYINPEIDRAEPSVKLHEPSLALYGGIDGMECIQKIIKQAPEHLTPNGQLWIEHEPEQSASIAKLANKNGFTATTHKDQYDIERYSVLGLL